MGRRSENSQQSSGGTLAYDKLGAAYRPEESVGVGAGSGVTAKGCGASQAAATAGTRRRRWAAACLGHSAKAWRPRARHPPLAHLTAAPVRRKRWRALSAAVLAACARELSIAATAAASRRLLPATA